MMVVCCCGFVDRRAAGDSAAGGGCVNDAVVMCVAFGVCCMLCSWCAVLWLIGEQQAILQQVMVVVFVCCGLCYSVRRAAGETAAWCEGWSGLSLFVGMICGGNGRNEKLFCVFDNLSLFAFEEQAENVCLVTVCVFNVQLCSEM